MKCEWVQENILLHIYNELADDARYELEQHLGRCTDCASELKGARGFHGLDHLKKVVVRGTAEKDPQGNLTVVAKGVFVRP